MTKDHHGPAGGRSAPSWSTIALPAVALAAVLLCGCDENPLACTNPQSNGTWPFDIKWCFTDDNGLPLNPFYYGGPFVDPQQSTLKDGNAQNYAHDVTFDSHWYSDPNLQFMSHTLGTAFTGRCGNWDGPVDDGDCCLDLLTPWLAGLNVRNMQTETTFLHLEFLTEETLERFDVNAGWNRLHHTDAAAVSRQLQNAQVIANGVWGMDFGHGDRFDGKAELHPVFALALQTTPRPVSGGQEVWQFFARRQGDNNHGTTWNTDWVDTVLRFPLETGLTAPPHADDLWGSSTSISVGLQHDGGDLVLTLHLPDQSDWVCGTLVIPYGRIVAGGVVAARSQRLAKVIDGLALTPKQTKDLLARLRETNGHLAQVAQSSAKYEAVVSARRVVRDGAPAKGAKSQPAVKAALEGHLVEFQSASRKLEASANLLLEYANQHLSAKQRQVLQAYLDEEVGPARLTPRPVRAGRHPPRLRAVKSRVTLAQREEAAKRHKAGAKAKTPAQVHTVKLPKVVAQRPPAKAPATAHPQAGAHALIGRVPSQTAMPALQELLKQAEKSLAERAKPPPKK
jgi:hypothetical protein